MMTPLELEKLEIDKHFGKGYSISDVDDAMNVIKNDYEALYKENIAFRDKITMLEELVSKYKAMEETMKNSIMLAQQTGEAALSNAHEQAESIIQNAKSQAEAILSENESEQKKLLAQSKDIKKDISVFAAKNISLLQSQIEILNQIKHDSISD